MTGKGPAKLLEYNADTPPRRLYESCRVPVAVLEGPS